MPVPQPDAPPRVQENVVGGDLRAFLTTKIRRLPLPRDTLDPECCKKKQILIGFKYVILYENLPKNIDELRVSERLGAQLQFTLAGHNLP